jgi:hypothetical protein
MGVKYLQVLPDGDLRSVEILGKIGYQYSAVAVQGLDNRSPAFFIQHRGRSPRGANISELQATPKNTLRTFHLYPAEFRLSIKEAK